MIRSSPQVVILRVYWGREAAVTQSWLWRSIFPFKSSSRRSASTYSRQYLSRSSPQRPKPASCRSLIAMSRPLWKSGASLTLTVPTSSKWPIFPSSSPTLQRAVRAANCSFPQNLSNKATSKSSKTTFACSELQRTRSSVKCSSTTSFSSCASSSSAPN